MALEDIYTTLIMEESRSKHNKKEIENPTCSELGHNPSCGDEITLHIRLNDGVLEDLSFTGVGCAISQASTSIMIDTVRGKTVEEALHLTDTFINMIQGVAISDEEMDELGDALAFEGVSKLPARVKCAVLPWHTLKNILTREEK